MHRHGGRHNYGRSGGGQSVTCVYLGGGTIAEVIPGLADALSAAGEGLRLARTEVDVAISGLGVAGALLSTAAAEIEAAKDALAGSVLGPINNAISAANGLLSQLNTISDPNLYLNNALSAINAAALSLAGLGGAAYVAQALASANAGLSSITSNYSSSVATVDAMTNAASYLGPVLSKINEVSGALSAANAATLGAMVIYTTMMSGIANSGMHAFWYDGPIANLGSELDATSGASGVFGSATIGGPILFCKTSDSTTLATLGSIFGA